MRTVRHPRLSRAVWAVAAVAAVAASTVTAATASPGSAAAASARPNAPAASPVASRMRFAVDRPLCAQPANPRLMRCFALKRVSVRRGTPGAYRYQQPAGVRSGPAGGYTPAALAKAYGFNPNVNRARTTVAVVMWHDNPDALRDLNAFDHRYGFPRETARSFRKVNQDGHAAPLPAADRDSASEISLDLQTVRAVCRTCRLLLVEASRPTDASVATAENSAVRLGARIVTNSFGEPEHRVSARVRKAFDHPGTVLIASTGDDGWYGWDYSNSARDHSDSRPSFPASYPGVVAVGGTTLTLRSGGTRAHETVWNDNGPNDTVGHRRARPIGASGGGCSRLYPAEPWQRHTPGYAAAGCNGRRLAADVAVDGDPQTGFDVHDSYGSSGWVTIGGTSLSAPLVAGMYALAGGSRGAAYGATQLYANSSAYPSRRYDVSAGGNSFCGGADTASCAKAVQKRYPRYGTHNPNDLRRGLLDCSFPRGGADATAPPIRSECNAAKGFDGPTGIGSPASIQLFSPTAPAVSISAPPVKRAGNAVRFTAQVREALPGTHVRSYTWHWGDGRAITTRGAVASHTYRRPGVYAVSVRILDSRWQTGRATTRIKIVSG